MTPELNMTISTAQEAGSILMQYFGRELDVSTKTDEFDPVTLADTTSDEFIRKTIAETFPQDAIPSEENSLRPINYTGRVWMVDPLDGTKDFIAGGSIGSRVCDIARDKIDVFANTNHRASKRDTLANQVLVKNAVAAIRVSTFK